jgi:hypothetical protein
MFFLLNVFLQHLILVSVVCVGNSVSGVACGQLWWLRLQIKSGARWQVLIYSLIRLLWQPGAFPQSLSNETAFPANMQKEINQEFRPCHDECSTLGNPKKVFPNLVNTLDVRPIYPHISHVMRCKFPVISIMICMMDPRFAPDCSYLFHHNWIGISVNT